MSSYRILLPSKSALVHMRFLFSFLLMPVFLFALSQAPQVILLNAVLTFIIWHVLVYPASNGYNSYFDRDEGSIALVEDPPPVDKSLYYFSLLLDVMGILLAFLVSTELVLAVFLYGMFSKLYSHRSTRLKKYPLTSFLIVFIFQGASVYWSSYAAISGLSVLNGWNMNFVIAGMICSCLIGATYPLTQVYQHEEDLKRGDRTLSMVLGIKGSFLFTAILFLMATILLFIYWQNLGRLYNFWLFLPLGASVAGVFFDWYTKVRKDSKQANFRNMSRMTIVSGAMMWFYFAMLNFNR
jgi:4-hydroxybenzoate polyprenyltransferase